MDKYVLTVENCMECSVQGFPPNVTNVPLSVAVRWCDTSRAHQHVYSFILYSYFALMYIHYVIITRAETTILLAQTAYNKINVPHVQVADRILFQVCVGLCYMCCKIWSICCFKCLYFFCSAVPSVAPTELTAIPLSPHSLQLSWKPLADEEVRGELVNYTIRYHRKHHGHRPKFVHIEPNRYGLCKLSPFQQRGSLQAMVSG